MRYRTHCLDCSTGRVINGPLDYLTLSWRALPKHRSSANKTKTVWTVAKHFCLIHSINTLFSHFVKRLFTEWMNFQMSLMGKGQGARGVRRPLRVGLFLNWISFPITSKKHYLLIKWLLLIFCPYWFLLYVYYMFCVYAEDPLSFNPVIFWINGNNCRQIQKTSAKSFNRETQNNNIFYINPN